jgi:hypothetical protein
MMINIQNLKCKLLSFFANSNDIADEVKPCMTANDCICGMPENERIKLIAIGAYLLAEKRNFAPGHEDEDWLVAEDSVNKCMY